MNEAGWEIATHGYKWIDYRDVPAEVEAQHIAEAIEIHTAIAGSRPLGFYQGRSSINTIPLGMAEGGFLYCADSYADDLPYWIEGPKGPQLVVPYTLDSNDMRFAAAQGFNSGDQFYAYLKDSFDTLYAEGATAPKMLSIGLHCRLVGRPGRAASLARFLDYVSGHDKVWVATRLDIARHWIRKHPPAGGWKPSRMAARFSSSVSAASMNIRPGSRKRPSTPGSDRRPTAPPASARRWRARWRRAARPPSARSSTPIPILPANSPWRKR